MREVKKILLMGIAMVLLTHSQTSAAIVAEPSHMVAGSFDDVYFTIRGGCDAQGGEDPAALTDRIEVEVPSGVLFVRPYPKVGWKVQMESGRLDPPVRYSGDRIKTGVVRITWTTDSRPLAANLIDRFVFNARLPEQPGKRLYFPVTQGCREGEVKWDQETKGKGETDRPAPYVNLVVGTQSGSTVAATDLTTNESDRSGGALSWVAIVLSLLALAASGLAIYRSWPDLFNRD